MKQNPQYETSVSWSFWEALTLKLNYKYINSSVIVSATPISVLSLHHFPLLLFAFYPYLIIKDTITNIFPHFLTSSLCVLFTYSFLPYVSTWLLSPFWLYFPPVTILPTCTCSMIRGHQTNLCRQCNLFKPFLHCYRENNS